MEKEFIPYEQALELKELGYDEPNYFLKWYDSKGKIREGLGLGEVKAPLYQQAFRWFREKHRLAHQFQYYHIPKWTFQVVEFTDIKITPNILVSETSKILTYEEAELECLKKLIEIVKNKIK